MTTKTHQAKQPNGPACKFWSDDGCGGIDHCRYDGRQSAVERRNEGFATVCVVLCPEDKAIIGTTGCKFFQPTESEIIMGGQDEVQRGIDAEAEEFDSRHPTVAKLDKIVKDSARLNIAMQSLLMDVYRLDQERRKDPAPDISNESTYPDHEWPTSKFMKDVEKIKSAISPGSSTTARLIVDKTGMKLDDVRHVAHYSSELSLHAETDFVYRNESATKVCTSPMDHDCLGVDCKDCQYFNLHRKDLATELETSNEAGSKEAKTETAISTEDPTNPPDSHDVGRGDAPTECKQPEPRCMFLSDDYPHGGNPLRRCTSKYAGDPEEEIDPSSICWVLSPEYPEVKTTIDCEYFLPIKEPSATKTDDAAVRGDALPDLQIGDRAKRIVNQFRSLGADSRHIGFVAADEPGATENDILDAVLVSPILAYDAKRRYVKLIDSQDVGRVDAPPVGTDARDVWDLATRPSGSDLEPGPTWTTAMDVQSETVFNEKAIHEIVEDSDYLEIEPGRTIIIQRKAPS